MSKKRKNSRPVISVIILVVLIAAIALFVASLVKNNLTLSQAASSPIKCVSWETVRFGSCNYQKWAAGDPACRRRTVDPQKWAMQSVNIQISNPQYLKSTRNFTYGWTKDISLDCSYAAHAGILQGTQTVSVSNLKTSQTKTIYVPENLNSLGKIKLCGYFTDRNNVQSNVCGAMVEFVVR